jgi:tetratricopeptide (TPR) repeat protein/GAF domain-containing protein
MSNSLANKKRSVNGELQTCALADTPPYRIFHSNRECVNPQSSLESLATMGDANKIIERADKLLDKGKPDLALAEYRSALDLQPGNEQLLQKAADLSLSIGQSGLASELLLRLFSLAVEGKQLNPATVLFRKLQRLKTLDPEMVSRYAELCESISRREAAEAYRVAFREFQRLGDLRRALDCISHSLKFDPRLEDYRAQARIAEALHKPIFAADALVHLGIMLERLGQDASDTYERAYANDPSNMAARLGYGRALIAQNRPNEAIELLEPLATYPSSPEEAREPYALALLAVGRVEEAEPFVWGLFERNPGANLAILHSVIGGLIDRDRADRALLLTRRLEEFLRKAGRRTEFMSDMAHLAGKSKPNVAFLEYLAELYNSANREIEYSQILSRLFDIYFATANYAKALDALDRAIDIDSYEATHKDRVHMLAGHVPEDRLQAVVKRLGLNPIEHLTVHDEKDNMPETPAPKILEDLILQAEIFLQYGMREKALQKIEQLKSSFAAEVESNLRVRQLFISAGLAIPARRDEPTDQLRTADAMVRATEVSRLIARQNDPRLVLVTAVNQIGSRWQYSRCLAALATPGKPPSLVVEYCSPDVPKSERNAMVRLLALSQRLTANEPVFRAADVQLSEPLAPIRQELARLNIHSLVILALLDEDQPIGLFIVQQCGVRRRWSPDDVALLRSMADQIALAVHGARLRSLVSTLGVAEEKTGLLKRSSYIDAVIAELKRHRGEGDSLCTLALLQVASLTSELQTEYAVAELVRTLRSIAQDQAMSFRFDRDTVALLLPRMDVTGTEALVGRLRDVLEPIAVTITAGIAQAGSSAGFDPEDTATEWINRVARALSLAATLPERLCTLPPESASIL